MLRLLSYAALGLVVTSCVRLSDEPSFRCEDDADCPDGQRCARDQAECLARGSCYVDRECGESEFCAKGIDASRKGNCEMSQCDPNAPVSACGLYACDPDTHACVTECSYYEDCEPEATCREGRCLKACSSDSGCSRGESCFASACIADACAGKDCAPYACDTESGQCKTECSYDAECVGDAKCDGSRTQAGICKVPTCSDGCGNYACSADAVTCLGSCARETDCTNGSQCMAGRCLVSCASDTECAPYVCTEQGTCKDSCALSLIDCSEGAYCNDFDECEAPR